MSAIEKVLKQCKEYGDEPQTFCAGHVNDAIAELARLQAIEVAAEGTFKALNGTLSVLRMWREFAPRNWDETDIEAVDMANKSLTAYEKVVQS